MTQIQFPLVLYISRSKFLMLVSSLQSEILGSPVNVTLIVMKQLLF